jgi:hypothetical protein
MVEKLWVIGEGHALRSDAIHYSSSVSTVPTIAQ